MVLWPGDFRHLNEGSSNATLPGQRELLVRLPSTNQRGAVATFPCPVHHLRGWCSAGNLTLYSARLSTVPGFLARLDDVGLSCVTNGAGPVFKPRRRPHNDGLRECFFGTTSAPPRPSAAIHCQKQPGKPGSTSSWRDIVGILEFIVLVFTVESY